MPKSRLSFDSEITFDKAYLIQEAIIATRWERGEQLSGIKLGFTNTFNMEQMGINERTWGRPTNRMHVLNIGKFDYEKQIHSKAEPVIPTLFTSN